RVGLIHSRLKEDEKRAAMDAFSKGELSVLVATSVVEVGVDVPNAAAMVVEHADGFALAEEDLRIRGPGEIAGTAQSGYLRLTIADPIRDALVLEEARAEAFA